MIRLESTLVQTDFHRSLLHKTPSKDSEDLETDGFIRTTAGGVALSVNLRADLYSHEI